MQGRIAGVGGRPGAAGPAQGDPRPDRHQGGRQAGGRHLGEGGKGLLPHPDPGRGADRDGEKPARTADGRRPGQPIGEERTRGPGEIRKTVRERYAGIARREGPCCGAEADGLEQELAESVSRRIGYSEEEMESVPEGANLGLGCGNPTALASMRRGETVLDLGAGAGVACFLASKEVGPEGRVMGVDMTPEMVEKARENARRGGYGNVEFRFGEIENLPVADGTGDGILSNCVINLSPNKGRVFQEAFRVLKPGGRVMISDLVVSKPLSQRLRRSVSAYVG